MRRIGRHKRNKQKQIIIVSTISLLLLLTIGYAAFSTNLSLTAKGNIEPRKDLYVSAIGSDETGNGTRNKPYQTINKAYEVAEDTATINILTDLTIDKEASFNEKNITIQTASGIDTATLSRGTSYKGALLSQYRGELTVQNLVIDGRQLEAEFSLISANFSTVNLKNGTVIQNNIDIEDHGGGCVFFDCTVTIDGAKFLNNTVMHQPGGGGAFISRRSNITINSSEFIGNVSKYSAGGAIFFGDNGYKLTIISGIFQNNSAAQGGAITIASSELEINNGEFSNNSATAGGTIYVYSLNGDVNNGYATLTINNVSITNNTAATNGGGIYIVKGNIYNYVSGTITNNTPDNVYIQS